MAETEGRTATADWLLDQSFALAGGSDGQESPDGAKPTGIEQVGGMDAGGVPDRWQLPQGLRASVADNGG